LPQRSFDIRDMRSEPKARRIATRAISCKHQRLSE
jgi:hypothetical protein